MNHAPHVSASASARSNFLQPTHTSFRAHIITLKQCVYANRVFTHLYLPGSREDIEKVMHAFDAYVQDKMSHFPLTLIRTPGGSKWIRIYGLVGTSELMKEYDSLYKK